MPGGGIYYEGRFHLLYVHLDSIAVLREAMGADGFGPADIAEMLAKSGCDGITVHLQRDRRHIADEDLHAIRSRIRGKLNLELALSPEMTATTGSVRPDKVIILPGERMKVDAFGGPEAGKALPMIKDAIKKIHDQDIRASLCIAPARDAVALAKETGADFIHIHTGAYGHADRETGAAGELGRIYRAADHAVAIGIKVSAGHGLNYSNVLPVLKARALEEVNIGHAIFSRSVLVGIDKAVEEMIDILD